MGLVDSKRLAFAGSESLFFLPGGMPPLQRAAVRARTNVRDQGNHSKRGTSTLPTAE